uniref:Uncharacterized protein n=1 Tax=Anguilla anguilla TaxID=7936 RepID=A0A0E9Q486_ANGAN
MVFDDSRKDSNITSLVSFVRIQSTAG